MWTNIFELRPRRRPAMRTLRKFNADSTATKLSPVIERAGDANERARVDDVHASQIDPNDRRSDRNVSDERFGARCGEVGQQSNNIDRRAVLMRLEPNLAEFHATLP